MSSSVFRALRVAVAAVIAAGGLAAAGGTPAFAASWTPPPENAQFDYQIGEAYTPSSTVRIVDRDRLAKPVSGLYNICYLNGFQTQPAERSWWEQNHADLLLKQSNGKIFIDPDWPDEDILDVSTAANRSAIAAIEYAWIDGCASAGYQGLEIDNLDTFTRGYPKLTKAGSLAFAKLLTDRAHAKGLAVAQKNTSDLGSDGKTKAGFDFAVAEECQRYKECGSYTDVYGARVIEIEYTDYSRTPYTTACSAQGKQISVILRDRFVVSPSGKDKADYRYEWC